jgi:hypothetical protein
MRSAQRGDVASDVPMENVDRLLLQLSAADIFVALLELDRRGSAITVSGQQCAASFVEMELFRAAFTTEPVVILSRMGSSPTLA